jgi:hypothetical protein
LPALAFLLALSVLTAIVWWRVLHRNDAVSSPTTVATPTVTCAPGGHKVTFPKTSTVTVKILNGNGQAGLASSVEGQLKSRGFKSAGVGDAASLLTGVGELRYGPSGKQAAVLLGYYLPRTKLVPITRADATVDVVVGKGFTGLASQKTVQAAEAKASKPC